MSARVVGVRVCRARRSFAFFCGCCFSLTYQRNRSPFTRSSIKHQAIRPRRNHRSPVATKSGGMERWRQGDELQLRERSCREKYLSCFNPGTNLLVASVYVAPPGRVGGWFAAPTSARRSSTRGPPLGWRVPGGWSRTDWASSPSLHRSSSPSGRSDSGKVRGRGREQRERVQRLQRRRQGDNGGLNGRAARSPDEGRVGIGCGYQ